MAYDILRRAAIADKVYRGICFVVRDTACINCIKPSHANAMQLSKVGGTRSLDLFLILINFVADSLYKYVYF